MAAIARGGTVRSGHDEGAAAEIYTLCLKEESEQRGSPHTSANRPALLLCAGEKLGMTRFKFHTQYELCGGDLQMTDLGYDAFLNLDEHARGRQQLRGVLDWWLNKLFPDEVDFPFTIEQHIAVEIILREVQVAADVVRLHPDDLAVLQAAIDTISAQAKSPRPNRRILHTALTQVQTLTVGVIGGVGGNYLTTLLQDWHIWGRV